MSRLGCSCRGRWGMVERKEEREGSLVMIGRSEVCSYRRRDRDSCGGLSVLLLFWIASLRSIVFGLPGVEGRFPLDCWCIVRVCFFSCFGLAINFYKPVLSWGYRCGLLRVIAEVVLADP